MTVEARDLDEDKARWHAEMTAKPKFSDLPQDLQERFRKDVLESLDGSTTGSPAMDTKVDYTAAEIPEEITTHNVEEVIDALADPQLTLQERTQAESEALFNPPTIRTEPNPNTNAGYDEGENL